MFKVMVLRWANSRGTKEKTDKRCSLHLTTYSHSYRCVLNRNQINTDKSLLLIFHISNSST